MSKTVSDCVCDSRIWRWSEKAKKKREIPFKNSQAQGDVHAKSPKWILLRANTRAALGSIETFCVTLVRYQDTKI